MCGIFGYKGSTVSSEVLEKSFLKLQHRGPDNLRYNIDPGKVFLGFHRLAIMDLTHHGNQPFEHDSKSLLCNGEIYNYDKLKAEVEGYDFHSTSDCEILIPLIEQFGLETTCKKLDAEFALIWYDHKSDQMLAARDPIGIRPLFWGKTQAGELAFASEAKALTDFCQKVEPFPPGHLWDGSRFVSFRSVTSQVERDIDITEVLQGISQKLTEGVRKRMMADAPLGFLLSGGLDSSLVCALAAKLSKKPIKTYSVGSVTDAIDNKYAEEVARYIGSKHTTVTFTQDEVMESLDELIRMLETWDITTVRASIGMYLVCKWIRKNTQIKVLMTGEVSDELFGYKYTDFAPSPEEFQKEAQKRIRELHVFDVLRADRCISAHSIEARVPFGDLDFVDHVMSTPAVIKMNSYGQGKYLLRKAFDGSGLLPDSILYREKAAFSDAVGHSVADGVKAYAEEMISDKELFECKALYEHGTPVLKEALLYRRIFEKHYPGHAKLISDFWLPNREWENCDVVDPSARVLPNYGTSGE